MACIYKYDGDDIHARRRFRWIRRFQILRARPRVRLSV
jgi:hypothetical protein